ncbi:MAG: ATP-binding protein [Paracoccaceae bacterium]
MAVLSSLSLLRRLLAVVPSIVVIAFIDVALHLGLTVPVPFITVLLSVVVAGSLGGFWPGLSVGLISSVFLFHAYSNGLGPVMLTGEFTKTAFSASIFTTVGVILGRLKDNHTRAVLALTEQERVLRLALSIETAKKDKQAAIILQSEERLRRAVRVARVGYFTWDVKTGNCLFCSDHFADLFGMTPDALIEQSKGTAPFIKLIHEDDHLIFSAAVAKVDKGEAMEVEYRIVHPDETVRFVRQFAEPIFDDTGQVVETVGCTIDLTDLREAEARVRQSQRIEAIGTLTGGIAHDFNNLLAVIMGNIELTVDGDLSELQKEYLKEALWATKRGAELSKNLLSFARRAHLTPVRMNLNKHIQNSVGWGLRILPENISIENSFMAGLWDTELDATSLDNAVINLLLNARDAMPDGGKITIETANMRIGPEYVQERHENIEPGRYVMLAISDTGQGIPDDIVDRIFEPFFTNKPVGKGSGLGLSMVQGFMKQSGGTVQLYSEVGVGTTFKLYFKAVTTSNEDEAFLADTRIPSGHGALRILVSEDEDAVGKVLRQMLEEAGHQVIIAATGDAAFKAFNAAEHIDLLITDVVMPGTLQGPALAKEIRSIKPDLPCIFLSGYASEATVHGNGLKPSDIRLMKPVSRDDLLNAVLQAMSSNKSRIEPSEVWDHRPKS